MTKKQLEIFCSVAKHLNFTKAAEELYMAQPTLSRQLKLLEEEWGFPLFVRDTKEVRLTPKGAVMLVTAQEVIRMLDDAVHAQNSPESSIQGTVNIGLLESLDINMNITSDIMAYAKEYPSTYPTIRQMSFGDLRRGLESGDLDIIFTMDFEIPSIPDVVSSIYSELPVGIIISADNPICQKENADLCDFAEETFVFPSEYDSPGRVHHFNEMLERHYGITAKHHIYAPNRDTVILYAQMGKGAAIVSEDDYKRSGSEPLRFFPLPETFGPSNLVYAWKKKNLNPAVTLYTNLLAKKS